MCLTNKLHIQTAIDLKRQDFNWLFSDDIFAVAFLEYKHLIQHSFVQLCQWCVDGLDKILAQISYHTSQRISDARSSRNKHSWNCQFFGYGRGMKRPCPTKGKEAKITRISTK